MFPFVQKLKFLLNYYVLIILSFGYLLAELGHFLIGVTSKATAQDLHYGDIACQVNNTEVHVHDLPKLCSSANNSETCLQMTLNGTPYCEWTYNGLGIDYQIIAGPSFIAVYTVLGVVLGFAADRFNRVRLLALCTLLFGIAVFLMGSVKEYWHLFLLRMLLAAGEAGCNPLSTGILSDMFPEEKRGLVLSIFNWGIYAGYGLAFPVGRYVTTLNIWDLGWRMCYYGAGMGGIIIFFFTAFTLREPERKEINEDMKTSKEEGNSESIWTVMMKPEVIMLCIAASVRHTGGLCFVYNCDLFYNDYFVGYDLGWTLFGVTVGIGSIGVIAGGIISDKFVEKYGTRSRVACLAISQFISSPFAFGSVYFDPVWAMINLGISYFFAEMWFGIVFSTLVEIVPMSVRSTTVGIFLFVMNNIGGNLPILVEPVRTSLGFREALFIFYAGAYLLSSFLFLITMFMMKPPAKKTDVRDGQDNPTFVMERIPRAAPYIIESSHV